MTKNTTCIWAPVNHSVPAVCTLVVERPCGHEQVLAPTCVKHAEKFQVGTTAPNPTTCLVCGEVNSMKILEARA